MKKLRTTATALLLTTALLLSGCAEQSNTPAPGADTSSEISESSFSSSEGLDNSDNITSTTSESSTSSEDSSSTDSGNHPESSTDVSSNTTNPDAVPVEFTDEDRELQKILEELNGGLETVDVWLMGSIPLGNYEIIDGVLRPVGIEVIDGNYYWLDSSGADPILLTYRFLLPDDEPGRYGYYFLIPDNYEEHGAIMPNTYEGMRNFMLEYFSEEYTDNKMKSWFDRGSMIEKNLDGSYTITLEGKYTGRGGFCKLIEIDGKMYRRHSDGNKALAMDTHCQSAKVISKTEDTIVFSYLNGYGYEPDDYREEYGDVSLYEENAIIGVLKYERGGWRRDTNRGWMRDEFLRSPQAPRGYLPVKG